jgi:adenylate kinase family enzyme
VGKTTLGRALAARLGIAQVDSDDYFHFPTDPPYRRQRTPEDRCALIERDLGAFESWIVTGGVGTWVPAPALHYTLHILMLLPVRTRLERLTQREQSLYGARVLSGGDMEQDHREFMQWTAGYDDSTSEGTNTLGAHEYLLASAACPVLRLPGPMRLEDAVARVLDQIRHPL